MGPRLDPDFALWGDLPCCSLAPGYASWEALPYPCTSMATPKWQWGGCPLGSLCRGCGLISADACLGYPRTALRLEQPKFL